MSLSVPLWTAVLLHDHAAPAPLDILDHLPGGTRLVHAAAQIQPLDHTAADVLSLFDAHVTTHLPPPNLHDTAAPALSGMLSAMLWVPTAHIPYLDPRYWTPPSPPTP